MTEISERQESDDESEYSDSSEVFAPKTIQVDGRKREAKRLKSRTRVP
jgi:hypothetical protein